MAKHEKYSRRKSERHDRPTERLSDRSFDRPSDRPSDQLFDHTFDRPSNRPSNRLNNQTFDRPSDQPTNQPSNQPSDRPSDRPTHACGPFEASVLRMFERVEGKEKQPIRRDKDGYQLWNRVCHDNNAPENWKVYDSSSASSSSSETSLFKEYKAVQMEASRNADNTGFDYDPDSLRQNWVRGKLQEITDGVEAICTTSKEKERKKRGEENNLSLHSSDANKFFDALLGLDSRNKNKKPKDEELDEEAEAALTDLPTVRKQAEVLVHADKSLDPIKDNSKLLLRKKSSKGLSRVKSPDSTRVDMRKSDNDYGRKRESHQSGAGRQSARESGVESFHGDLKFDDDVVGRYSKVPLLPPEKIGPLVPNLLFKYQLAIEEYKTFNGIVVFCDISGFTALSQTLKKKKDDKGAAETLHKDIGSYLTKICQTIMDLGGDVLNFAGDAILAVWDFEGADLSMDGPTKLDPVIVAILNLQALHGTYVTSVQTTLLFKTGIAWGNYTIGYLGNSRCKYFCGFGQAVADANNAEAHCLQRWTVLTPIAWDNVTKSFYIAEVLADGYVRVKKLAEKGQNYAMEILTVITPRQLLIGRFPQDNSPWTFPPGHFPSGYFPPGSWILLK